MTILNFENYEESGPSIKYRNVTWKFETLGITSSDICLSIHRHLKPFVLIPEKHNTLHVSLGTK